MNKEEALKLALAALRPISHNSTNDPRGQADIAITAIEQALAVPVQSAIEIKPPNESGSTNCIVRWMAETPAGWIGAWNKQALEQFVTPTASQSSASLVDGKTLSPTAGMNIAQRILHVGGRNNTAGYVEFGSIQAVEALVCQVLRDLPRPHNPLPTDVIVTMYDESPTCDGDMIEFARAIEAAHGIKGKQP